MTQFHANVATQINPNVNPVNINYLFKAFEQSEAELVMSKLNLKLAIQCGEDFKLSFFSGSELAELPQKTLVSLANCYAQVFNESWGESWTTETALKEIMSCINCHEDYTPAMSLLFKDEDVVGFCWGFFMDTESLTEDSAPFSSSELKRHESVSVARYWLDIVSKKNKLVSIRELGVLKEYRQDKTPFLTLPLFEKAKEIDCQVAFFRTKLSSKAFKWSLGVGFSPLELFKVDGLLLMKGSVKYATKLLYGSIESNKKKRISQIEIIGNIKRYLCQ